MNDWILQTNDQFLNIFVPMTRLSLPHIYEMFILWLEQTRFVVFADIIPQPQHMCCPAVSWKNCFAGLPYKTRDYFCESRKTNLLMSRLKYKKDLNTSHLGSSICDCLAKTDMLSFKMSNYLRNDIIIDKLLIQYLLPLSVCWWYGP